VLGALADQSFGRSGAIIGRSREASTPMIFSAGGIRSLCIRFDSIGTSARFRKQPAIPERNAAGRIPRGARGWKVTRLKLENLQRRRREAARNREASSARVACALARRLGFLFAAGASDLVSMARFLDAARSLAAGFRWRIIGSGGIRLAALG